MRRSEMTEGSLLSLGFRLPVPAARLLGGHPLRHIPARLCRVAGGRAVWPGLPPWGLSLADGEELPAHATRRAKQALP